MKNEAALETDWWDRRLRAFLFCRFRSIAKSYFRRADGVLLLYDVTCEKSFLNVREWVDMIEVRDTELHRGSYTPTWKMPFLFFVEGSQVGAVDPSSQEELAVRGRVPDSTWRYWFFLQ